MRGSLSRTDAQAVVRHLLTGCESCREITRRFWDLGEGTIWQEQDERDPVREPGTIRKWRSTKALLVLVETRFGAKSVLPAAEAAATASPELVQKWVLRAHYQPCWEAVFDGRPLAGVRVVSIEELFAAAIGNPLETWCLRAHYASKGDDLRDTEVIQGAAPWLREDLHLVAGLQEDLRRHRAALLSCESERLARGLQATVTSRWLSFTLYQPDGFVIR
jgi:hypothetical protein